MQQQLGFPVSKSTSATISLEQAVSPFWTCLLICILVLSNLQVHWGLKANYTWGEGASLISAFLYCYNVD